jgi:hypothetical protein
MNASKEIKQIPAGKREIKALLLKVLYATLIMHPPSIITLMVHLFGDSKELQVSLSRILCQPVKPN